MGNVDLVQQAFLRVLDEKEYTKVRQTAADALAPYVGNVELVQQAFLRGVDQNEDTWLRRMAAYTLMPYAGSAGPIQQVFLSALDQDKDTKLRKIAADVLEPYAGSNEPIQKAFLRVLDQKNENTGLRQMAADAIAPYAGSAGPIQQVFLKVLDQDKDIQLRETVAKALIQYSIDSKDILDVLLKLNPLSAVSDSTLNHLSQRSDQGYPILLHLSSDQLKNFYLEWLFLASYKGSMPLALYYQDKALHFYTLTGPGKSIPASDEQFKKIAEAFESARKDFLNRNFEQLKQRQARMQEMEQQQKLQQHLLQLQREMELQQLHQKVERRNPHLLRYQQMDMEKNIYSGGSLNLAKEINAQEKRDSESESSSVRELSPMEE